MMDDYSNLPLDDVQRAGSIFLKKNKRVILGDKMGVGKTLQLLHAMVTDEYIGQTKFRLIACSKNALGTWRNEYKKWLPNEKLPLYLMEGDKNKKTSLIKQSHEKPGIYVCTYETIRDYQATFRKNWQHIIGDEVHKLRDRKGRQFKAFKLLKSPTVHLGTGSIMSKGPQDMWSVLNYLYPKEFSSYWKFVGKYCEVEDDGFGQRIVGAKNLPQLLDDLSDILIIRDKTNVPPKHRNFVSFDLDPRTREVYEQMDIEMVFRSGEGLILTPSVLGKIVRLRQLIVCPKTLDPSLPLGRGIEYIMSEIQRKGNKYTTVFSALPAAFPFFKEYARSLGYPVHELVGGISTNQRDARIEQFREQGGIMLNSIKYAQSYSMEFCLDAYMLGFEYDPQQNFQAEDRLHRKTTKAEVNINYVLANNSHDARILEILDIKQGSTNYVYKNSDWTLDMLADDH